jgi:hypothetical protein
MAGKTPPAKGGMFSKDKEIGNRIDTEFDLKEDFILWGAKLDGEVDTSIGKARKTVLTVSHLDAPDTVQDCTTLGSAIADKAAYATDDDFPAVVQLRKVAGRFGNEALVIQFVREWSAG